MVTISRFSCVALKPQDPSSSMVEFSKKYFPDAVFLHVEASRVEISDDVNSRTARQDYIPLVINKAKSLLSQNISVVFDMSGVKEQDENRIRNTLKSYVAPWFTIDVSADKDLWPEIKLDIPIGFDFRDIKDVDIIGDVHGCADELIELCRKLDYRISETIDRDGISHFDISAPDRTLVFVGDFVDRGPESIRCLSFVLDAVEQKTALAVIGNHDLHLFSFLKGEKKKLPEDLAVTVSELLKFPIRFQEKIRDFLGGLPTQLHFDSGKLIIAHAGCPEIAQGINSPVANKLSIFGNYEGTNQDGRPIRSDWADSYKGAAIVVHGHTPLPEPYVTDNVYCLDTGCVFGGALTALSYPDLLMKMVPAKAIWSHRPESDSFWNSDWRSEFSNFKM